MDGAEQGFLIVYEFEDDDRPLIIEDAGHVCFAHVRGPTGKIVTEVWLYNRITAATPANPCTHALEWGEKPLPSSNADLRVSISKSTNKPTVFSVLIRGELFAILRVGEKIGRSRLARKDGPLALRLPRPGESAWQIVSPYWTSVDIYGSANAFLSTFAQVPEPAGHLLAVRWCESEVCNGGFHQFFTNLTGVLAPEATRGLRAINLPTIAEIVEKAMALFGTRYPRENQERRQILSALADDPFSALDRAFYDSTADDVLYDAADAYAAQMAPAQAQLNLTPEPHADGRVCYYSR